MGYLTEKTTERLIDLLKAFAFLCILRFGMIATGLTYGGWPIIDPLLFSIFGILRSIADAIATATGYKIL